LEKILEKLSWSRKYVGAAIGGAYGVDPNWYTDSGATDQITGNNWRSCT
jgi:hypothetical protein